MLSESVTVDWGNKLVAVHLARPQQYRKCYRRGELISPGKGPWSSGYDVCLTRRSSPVRIRLGPPSCYWLRVSSGLLVHGPFSTGASQDCRMRENADSDLTRE